MLKNSNQFVAMECFENKTRIVVKIRRQQATAIRIVSASVEILRANREPKSWVIAQWPQTKDAGSPSYDSTVALRRAGHIQNQRVK